MSPSSSWVGAPSIVKSTTPPSPPLNYSMYVRSFQDKGLGPPRAIGASARGGGDAVFHADRDPWVGENAVAWGCGNARCADYSFKHVSSSFASRPSKPSTPSRPSFIHGLAKTNFDRQRRVSG